MSHTEQDFKHPTMRDLAPKEKLEHNPDEIERIVSRSDSGSHKPKKGKKKKDKKKKREETPPPDDEEDPPPNEPPDE